MNDQFHFLMPYFRFVQGKKGFTLKQSESGEIIPVFHPKMDLTSKLFPQNHMVFTHETFRDESRSCI